MAEFLTATKDGPKAETGQVAFLQVDGKRHKFFIHGDNLSDWRSGYRVGGLSSIKVERMARISHYTRTTDRQAAQILLDRIVAKFGAEKVWSEINSKPTLNGD